jgi:O-antigen ligase/Flp pilus assembly protein TadD
MLVAGVITVVLAGRHLVVPRGWGIGWVVFLVWGVIVSIYAVDPLHTWIGTPDRHLGLLAWAFFAVVFFAAASVRDVILIRPILKAAVVALAGIGIYVLLELIGLAPVELTSSSGRPGGPFGTPAYLGAACVLLVPTVIGAAVDGLGSLRWRRAAIAASFVGVVAVAVSQTRAAWVGLALAFVVVWPAIGGWVRSHRGIVLAACLLGVVIIGISPLADRVTSALDFESGGGRARIDEWRVGAAVLAEHPVVGLGFEGYRIGFAEGVDADYERRYGRAFTPDRAHSGVLDIGVTAGLPGMLIYLAGGLALVVSSIRGVRSGPPWLVGIAGGVVAYLGQQQFLFPIVEFDGVFWVFAGILVSATTHRAMAPAIPRGVWIVGLVLVGAASAAGGLDVVADRATRNALDLEQRADRGAAVERASDAVALRPDSIRYRFVAASIAGRDGTGTGYVRAVSFIDGALEVSPRDPVLLAARAGYRVDLAVAQRDRDLLAAAVAEWETLVARDPNHAQFRLELGIAYAVAGRPDDAETAWRAAAALAPASGAPWANLASLFIDRSDPDAASAALAELVAREPDSELIEPLRTGIDALGRENG